MRDYEVMTIHQPDLSEDEVSARVSALETHLSDNGASVKGRDIWGKRRFAYEIDHLTEGYYSVVTFEGGNDAAQGLDRMLSLQDDVVRHKIVRQGEE